MNQVKYNALGAQGYTGSIDDRFLKYLKANGATSSDLNDATIQFLVARGMTRESLDVMWKKFLFSKGYTDDRNTSEYKFWQAGGTIGPVEFAPSRTNVKLQLHFDGTNGSTTFTDTSPSPKTGVAAGNAQISTTGPLFGTGCGLFDGAGDVVDYSAIPAFVIGTSDWWVRMRLKTASFATARYPFAVYTIPTVSPDYYFNVGTTGLVTYQSVAGAFVGTTVVPLNTYFEVMISRVAGVNYTFINGVADAAPQVDATNYSNTQYMSIGGATNVVGTSSYWNGQIDEFQFGIGEGRATAYAPNAAPFPDS